MLGPSTAQVGPSGTGAPARSAPRAWQFVLLSLLLHVWLIALFGDTGGGDGNEDGWVSTFSARLQVSEPSSAQPPGGARPRAAARSPTNLPNPQARTEDAPTAASKPARESRVETSLPTLPDVAKIPALAREASSEASPLAPISVAPIAVVPMAAAPISTQASSSQATLPLVAPLTVEPLAMPRTEATFTIAVPAITERVLVAPATTARIDVAPLPPLPTIAPTVIVDVASTAVPPLMIAPIALPPSAALPGESAQRAGTVSSAALPVAPLALRPLEIPAAAVAVPNNLLVPTLPIEPVEVPLSTRATANVQSIDIPVARPAPTLTPSPTPAATAPPLGGAQSGTEVPPARSEEPSASPQAATSRVAPQPDAGRATSVGPPALLNAPAPPPAPSANARALDLDALRRQARELSRDGAGARALLPFPALPKETSKRDIEKAFDKALKRPDCNEAYRDMGLAAVIPLVRDALRDDGCRWQSPAPSQPERTPPSR
jgi:hypothetical protein